jgi:uncharacterized membrane protein
MDPAAILGRELDQADPGQRRFAAEGSKPTPTGGTDMRKKIMAMLSVALGLSGAVSPATAAHADSAVMTLGVSRAGIADCPANLICVWEGSNFTGRMAGYNPLNPGECHSFVYGYLSAYNRTVWRQRLWQSLSCSNGNVVIFGGDRLNLGIRRYTIGGWP